MYKQNYCFISVLIKVNLASKRYENTQEIDRCIRRKIDEVLAAECKHRDLYTVSNIVKK